MATRKTPVRRHDYRRIPEGRRQDGSPLELSGEGPPGGDRVMAIAERLATLDPLGGEPGAKPESGDTG